MSNKVFTVEVIQQTREKWNINPQSFCSLISEEKGSEPFFTVGLGKIIESCFSDYAINSKVIFFGFANSESSTYRVSCNCVVKVRDEVSELPADVAVAAQMIYAVSMLSPEAGMRFYVDKSIPDFAKLCDVIRWCGCDPYIENDGRLFDGSIVSVDRPNEIKITEQAIQVCLNEQGKGKICNSLGDDFFYKQYMVDGNIIPTHFMTRTCAKNISTALMYNRTKKDEVSDCAISDFSLSEKCFVQKMRNEFLLHINPGFLRVTVFSSNPDLNEKTILAKGIASYILDSKISQSNTINSGKNVLGIYRLFNGSVADCLCVMSDRDSIEAELHFDRTSYIYGNSQYGQYCGSSEIVEKKIDSIDLTDKDGSALVEIGKNSED